MDLTHKFTVPASVEETWAALNDIASVAGCFPGASVSSVEGDEFKGSCKVKLGPISLTYNGSGTFVEKDESARRFVVEAKGKDKRGNGTATATVTASMSAVSPESTDVEVITDLSITGRPAQFGRGVIQDVSDKLLQQFATCLQDKVGGASPGAAEPESAAAGSASEAAEAAAAVGEVGVTASGQPSVPEQPTADRREPSPEPPGSEVPAPAAPGAGAESSLDAAVADALVGDGVPGGPAADGTGPAVDGVASPTHQRVEALDLGSTILPVLLKRYWQPAVGALGALIGLLVLLRVLRRR